MRKATFILTLMLTLAQMATAQTQAHASTYTQRFSAFVDSLAARDTLSAREKTIADSTYQALLAEYKVVRDRLTDEEIRTCSKNKVAYQKQKTRLFINKTTGSVADSAEDVGDKVSRFFKRTSKKVQGAIDGFKKE